MILCVNCTIPARLQIPECITEPDKDCYQAHAELARWLVLAAAALDLNLDFEGMAHHLIAKTIKLQVHKQVKSNSYPAEGMRAPDYALFLVPPVGLGHGGQEQGCTACAECRVVIDRVKRSVASMDHVPR